MTTWLSVRDSTPIGGGVRSVLTWNNQRERQRMRTLIVAALSTTLIGCSCLMSPQSALHGCVSAGCPATVDPQSELRPASFTPRRVAPNVKSARAARTPRPTPVAAKSHKPPSDQEPNPTASVEENLDALTIVTPEPGATRKAKTTIAAKLDAPTSD